MKTKRTETKTARIFRVMIFACFIFSPALINASERDSLSNAEKQSAAEASYLNYFTEQSESFTEEEIMIEDWMMDVANYVNTPDEDEMKIEDWMTDVHHAFWSESSEEDDAQMLAIETWMTNPSAW